jgi:plastocyanin
MRRAAIGGAIAVALVAAAVAGGAGTDVRIHRLHLPPPPAGGDNGTSVPPAPGKPNPTDPSAPPGTSPPAAPPPPGAQPSPPPPPPSGTTCTVGGGATPVATATLDDTFLTLATTAFSVGPSLTFGGHNVGGFGHSVAIKSPGAAASLCETPVIAPTASDTFTITNLPAGSYVIYCTVHPTLMFKDITVS